MFTVTHLKLTILSDIMRVSVKYHIITDESTALKCTLNKMISILKWSRLINYGYDSEGQIKKLIIKFDLI